MGNLFEIPFSYDLGLNEEVVDIGSVLDQQIVVIFVSHVDLARFLFIDHLEVGFLLILDLGIDDAVYATIG